MTMLPTILSNFSSNLLNLTWRHIQEEIARFFSPLPQHITSHLALSTSHSSTCLGLSGYQRSATRTTTKFCMNSYGRCNSHQQKIKWTFQWKSWYSGVEISWQLIDFVVSLNFMQKMTIHSNVWIGWCCLSDGSTFRWHLPTHFILSIMGHLWAMVSNTRLMFWNGKG